MHFELIDGVFIKEEDTGGVAAAAEASSAPGEGAGELEDAGAG